LPSRSNLPSNVKPSSSAVSSVTTKSDSISIDDDSSSDDRLSNSNRFNRRPSPNLSKKFCLLKINFFIYEIIYLAIPNHHYTTVNSYQQNYDNTNSMNEQDRDESIESFKTDERSSKGKNSFSN